MKISHPKDRTSIASGQIFNRKYDVLLINTDVGRTSSIFSHQRYPPEVNATSLMIHQPLQRICILISRTNMKSEGRTKVVQDVPGPRKLELEFELANKENVVERHNNNNLALLLT